MFNSSWTPNNTEHKFPGKMTDLVLADCYLPESAVKQGFFDDINEGTPAAGLVISVSNDGEHKSKENLTFISYDSACMSCNISSGCFLKVCAYFCSIKRAVFVEITYKTRPVFYRSNYNSLYSEIDHCTSFHSDDGVGEDPTRYSMERKDVLRSLSVVKNIFSFHEIFKE